MGSIVDGVIHNCRCCFDGGGINPQSTLKRDSRTLDMSSEEQNDIVGEISSLMSCY